MQAYVKRRHVEACKVSSREFIDSSNEKKGWSGVASSKKLSTPVSKEANRLARDRTRAADRKGAQLHWFVGGEAEGGCGRKSSNHLRTESNVKHTRGCLKRVYRLPFKSIRRCILPIETTRALGRLAFTPQRAFEYHGRKCRGLPLLIGPWISPPGYTHPPCAFACYGCIEYIRNVIHPRVAFLNFVRFKCVVFVSPWICRSNSYRFCQVVSVWFRLTVQLLVTSSCLVLFAFTCRISETILNSSRVSTRLIYFVLKERFILWICRRVSFAI